MAGVFVSHGFWVGDTFKGSGEYVNHENAKIKAWMKKYFVLDAGVHTTRIDRLARNDLRAYCEKFVPDGPWLFKGPSEYYPVMYHNFPNMIAVMVFRDKSQSVETHVRRYGERVRQGATQIVERRHQFMLNVLMNRVDAFRVDAERVVNGDLAQVELILSQYGKTIDHRLAMEHISPDLFHQ